ncbi:MAG: hypothetical protein V4864_05575 [Pseudomonadota bacterium]
MQDIARLIFIDGVVPLWIAAGFADWACHRRTAIERTSGLPENVFHWVLCVQAGLVIGAVALLEPTAAVFAGIALLWLAHEVATWIELRYTVRLREVRPIEQMVHSFMEILPLVALGVLAVAHWDAVAAGDFGLRWKAEPWPAANLWGIGIAAALFNALPLGEETLRCWRVALTPALSRRERG